MRRLDFVASDGGADVAKERNLHMIDMSPRGCNGSASWVGISSLFIERRRDSPNCPGGFVDS
jgi:hypothetical protein